MQISTDQHNKDLVIFLSDIYQKNDFLLPALSLIRDRDFRDRLFHHQSSHTMVLHLIFE